MPTRLKGALTMSSYKDLLLLLGLVVSSSCLASDQDDGIGIQDDDTYIDELNIQTLEMPELSPSQTNLDTQRSPLNKRNEQVPAGSDATIAEQTEVYTLMKAYCMKGVNKPFKDCLNEIREKKKGPEQQSDPKHEQNIDEPSKNQSPQSPLISTSLLQPEQPKQNNIDNEPSQAPEPPLTSTPLLQADQSEQSNPEDNSTPFIRLCSNGYFWAVAICAYFGVKIYKRLYCCAPKPTYDPEDAQSNQQAR